MPSCSASCRPPRRPLRFSREAEGDKGGRGRVKTRLRGCADTGIRVSDRPSNCQPRRCASTRAGAPVQPLRRRSPHSPQQRTVAVRRSAHSHQLPVCQRAPSQSRRALCLTHARPSSLAPRHPHALPGAPSSCPLFACACRCTVSFLFTFLDNMYNLFCFFFWALRAVVCVWGNGQCTTPTLASAA